MVNERLFCNPSHQSFKELNLSALSTSNVSDEWRSWCHLHDHGGLFSSRGHNQRPSWTAEQNWSRSNDNGYWLRSREELESASLCAKICKHGLWHPHICCSVFSILTFCFAEFDTSVICHVVFMRCLGSCLLLSVGFQFKGQSLKYSLSMFQRKVDNWKPQAGSHVMGLCRWSISGRNDLLLSLPTGILLLPLAALFLFFDALFSVLCPD